MAAWREHRVCRTSSRGRLRNIQDPAGSKQLRKPLQGPWPTTPCWQDRSNGRDLAAIPGIWELGCTHYLSKEDFQERKRACSLRNPTAPWPLVVWMCHHLRMEWTVATVGSHTGDARRGVLKKGTGLQAVWEPVRAVSAFVSLRGGSA